MKRFKARLYDRTIKYTQKQTKFNSGQMNGQCGGFIRLLLRGGAVGWFTPFFAHRLFFFRIGSFGEVFASYFLIRITLIRYLCFGLTK